MGEAVYRLHSEPSTHVEVIIHVTESLEEEQRDRLISGLEQGEAIKSAEFCPLRYHLMLVNYDRHMLTSQDILERVTSQGFHAKLIGPV